MVSSPKFSDMASIILVFAFSSTCDNSFSSTYQAILHCLKYVVLFSVHISYGLTTKPCYFRVFAYRSYHNIADYMQPYKYFSSNRYSTFAPFSTRAFLLWSGFNSHMISTNLPSIFNILTFLLAYHHWSMIQGHQKRPRLFPCVLQWWDWWIHPPKKHLARIRLPYVCINFVAYHLHTTSLLDFHTSFILLCLLLAVLPFFVTLCWFQVPVTPLLSCPISGCNHFTWLLLPFAASLYPFLGCYLHECCIHS